MPAVLSGADEVAVQAFLDRKIPFARIPQLIGEVMRRHEVISEPTLEQVLATDRWAHQMASQLVNEQT